MAKEIPKYGYNYSRTHRPTDFDTLYLAVEMKKKIDRYVMNEKRVPKKWRYFIGKPASDYARQIRDCISWANDIKIDEAHPDPDRIRERIETEEKALRYCNLLQFQLLDIVEDCETATEDNLGYITKDLVSLIGKIKNWNASDIKRFSV